jgi:hypothetical protein
LYGVDGHPLALSSWLARMRDRVLAAEPPVAELAASRLLLGEALLGELLRAEHFAEGGVCGCTR